MTGPNDYRGAGWVQCARCGTVRPESETQVLNTPRAVGPGVTKLERTIVCTDTKWCGAQAGVGKGELPAVLEGGT